MADNDDDTEDLVPRSHIRRLEEQAAKSKELEAQLAVMQRDTAFARALGTIDHPARGYFEKGYDGELEVEAIRAAAKDAGIIGQPAPPATDNDSQPDAAEMAAHARMAAAAEGSSGNKPIDLIEAFGSRGSKKPEEIMQMARAAGRRMADDMQ